MRVWTGVVEPGLERLHFRVAPDAHIQFGAALETAERLRTRAGMGLGGPRTGPASAGLSWRSHREPQVFAYLPFADRAPDDCLAEVSSGVPITDQDQRLDDGIVRRYVERTLDTYRAALI